MKITKKTSKQHAPISPLPLPIKKCIKGSPNSIYRIGYL